MTTFEHGWLQRQIERSAARLDELPPRLRVALHANTSGNAAKAGRVLPKVQQWIVHDPYRNRNQVFESGEKAIAAAADLALTLNGRRSVILEFPSGKRAAFNAAWITSLADIPDAGLSGD